MNTIMKFDNTPDGIIKPETQRNQRGNTGVYEPVNDQTESSVTAQEAEHTYHYENREIKVKGRAVYENQQQYENAVFDNQNKIVNMYEGLKKETDDHPYADLENN